MKEKNLGELTNAGINRYVDRHGRTLLVNRKKKIAYIIDKNAQRKEVIFSKKDKRSQENSSERPYILKSWRIACRAASDLARSFAVHSVKLLSEVGRGAEAANGAYFLYRHIGGNEVMKRALKLHAKLKLGGRCADALVKEGVKA